jgi:hypothetical protein
MSESNSASMHASRPYFPDGYGVPETDEGMLPWSYVEGRLDKSINYWIATVDECNRPHATPVWGVWMEGALYFDGSPQTRRGRNLAANPALAVHLEDGTQAVILYGEAHELINSPLELRQILAEKYAAKYSQMGYKPNPEFWVPGGLWVVNLRRAYAWTSFPKDATRWRFESTPD